MFHCKIIAFKALAETNFRMLQHQITKDYYKPYLEATEPLFVKPREFEFVNRLPSGWTKYVNMRSEFRMTAANHGAG